VRVDSRPWFEAHLARATGSAFTETKGRETAEAGRHALLGRESDLRSVGWRNKVLRGQ